MKCSMQCVLSFVLATTAPAALAGIITPGQVSGGGGTATVVATTSGVVDFRVNKTFTSLAPIDISFDVRAGTIPLGSFDFSERVINNTGHPWFDFHLELGTGTGDGFRVIDTTTNLLFTSAPVPSECSGTIPNFNIELGQACRLTPFGGSPGGRAVLDFLSTSPDITAQNASAVESGHQLNLTFQIQVPNGISKFTLREVPTTDGKVRGLSVPEPGTLALLTACFVVLGFDRLGKATRHPIGGERSRPTFQVLRWGHSHPLSRMGAG